MNPGSPTVWELLIRPAARREVEWGDLSSRSAQPPPVETPESLVRGPTLAAELVRELERVRDAVDNLTLAGDALARTLDALLPRLVSRELQGYLWTPEGKAHRLAIHHVLDDLAELHPDLLPSVLAGGALGELAVYLRILDAEVDGDPGLRRLCSEFLQRFPESPRAPLARELRGS